MLFEQNQVISLPRLITGINVLEVISLLMTGYQLAHDRLSACSWHYDDTDNKDIKGIIGCDFTRFSIGIIINFIIKFVILYFTHNKKFI